MRRDWVASPMRTADSLGRPSFTMETGRPNEESDRTQQAAATPSPRTRTVPVIWTHTSQLLRLISISRPCRFGWSCERPLCYDEASLYEPTYGNRTKPAKWKAARGHHLRRSHTRSSGWPQG